MGAVRQTIQSRRYGIGYCNVRLDEFEETGRTVLRIIIPDDENRFPEDEECMEVYRLQLLETDELWRKDGTVS